MMLARTDHVSLGLTPPLPRPRRRFRTCLADPPWPYTSNSVARPGRNARRHYRTMRLAEIAALPIADLMADDAVLFLWVPGPLLVLGAHLKVMHDWGFKPSAMGHVWIKLKPGCSAQFISPDDLFVGCGHTTRKNAEFCLIGRRGRSIRRDKSVREVILAPRREHSRKPDDIHERIERYAPGPYLELFARQSRRGWTVWGDQATKFDAPARVA